MAIIKHVFTDVSDQIFFGMLTRAREEKLFVGDDNKVNIPALLSKLITHFSTGNYAVLPIKEAGKSVKKTVYYNDRAKRIHADIPEKLFYEMLERAKKENAFVEEGKVMIGKVLHMLVEAYAKMELVLLAEHKNKDVHTERFDYTAAHNSQVKAD